MTSSIFRARARHGRALRGIVASLAIGTLFLAGCDAQDKLLSADTPDIIDPSNLNSVDGSEALRVGALERWRLTTGGDNANGNDNTWLFGGLLADEWATSSTFVQNDEADQRNIRLDNSTVTFAFRKLNRVRTAVNQSIPFLKKYQPTVPVKVAELYLARGFAEMQLASDFCNGIPLSDASNGPPVVLGAPMTVAALFDVAVATLDSGIAAIGSATDAESVRILAALRIAKARALLGNDKVAAAATAIATGTAIATTYTYDHTFSTTNGTNALWGQPNSARRYMVGDSVEGNSRNLLVKNAIPFFSSKDARVPSAYTITVRSATRSDTTKSQDGSTNSRTTSLWGETSAVTVLNGTDARLIEAEAQLRAGNPAGMLATLNALRATPPKVGDVQPTAAQLPPLVLPATTAGQVDLLFREKAFWTFGRGQRLGDLRRLIRYYQRTPDTTFPVGAHYRGGVYGVDVNLPVPQEEQNNPNFTGCFDRKA
jgi:hypothetical protein